ncbi:imidazole glycerol phosphate synthase subunit HisH [Gynuella sunshinyii]|uniref:Imidazole glycerol phosphate synthase subunit HisH n=1 Tax=Gynuella sunshinyii YC6258 TaxID=1445510 RepID=A0A0C5VFW8_9GAMM|nr:imidazole glycerol phosphate synthase subunit HisH [Gynuella sunshinyii]AJQ92258.1 glutamine amidotransferase [Gynuella sunshinyii YC6258]
MTSKSVAVIDYGMGNLHSAAKALQHVSPETKVVVTSDARTILSCDHVIVPGVGAIRDCVGEILRLELGQVIAEAMKNKPVLGICIGMQTFMDHSDENGGVDCLGFFAGQVHHFGEIFDENGQALKVPHMGWNNVFQREPHPLWNNIADGSRFYFVHSYYVECDDENEVAGTCNYGLPFDAVIFRDNIAATQFHPEKSSTAGLQLLSNFLAWDGTL